MQQELRTVDAQSNKSDNNPCRPWVAISDSHKPDTEQSASIEIKKPMIGTTLASNSSSQYTLRSSPSVSDSQTPSKDNISTEKF
ncbi:hypothetical protein AVEN_188758-1 [Araneus ventricosus]|uniref:Uncharacterized protein n=1 Tax=Araneus ventricosus TaxID=182803 RepID=A0A4Y2S9W8_ARAVE|nr:hypothetical protein AVEN_188758-1 [Araneus ventricosus]